MTLRSILTRTATIALAAAAFAAPTASARPADLPPAAATQQRATRSAAVSEYPTRPAQGEQANPRPDTTPTATATAERDIAWSTIGIGIAGSLLAIGTVAGIAGRTRRTARARITA